METTNKVKIWTFVMSSFSRTYGVNRVKAEEKFHEIALFWSDENEVDKYKTLEEYDEYFKNLYENWQ